MNLTETLGEGPRGTTVYAGTYGTQSSFGFFGYNQGSRNVLVKKIDKNIVDNDIIDCDSLKTLNHPNVACYIEITEEAKFLQPNCIYIVQDYCEFTLQALLDYPMPIQENILKIAVQQIASGLNYLHYKGIAHMNLKPSNILVKPPLSNPEGFVLTDYAYTQDLPGDPQAYQYMAPEFMQFHSAIIQFYSFEARSVVDMYSFGKILLAMYQKCEIDSMNVVNRFLFLLLVEQLLLQDWHPEERITCDEILRKHPYVIIRPDQNNGGYAEARMSYIKEIYDKIKDNHSLRKQIEEDASCVTRLFIPWNEPEHSFGGRIYSEMNKRPQIRKKYDGNSFMDLLRLIRNTKEHPMVEKNLKNLKEEVNNDAFSTNFPHVIPIIYVCVECPNTSKYLLRILSSYTEMS